MTVNLGVYIVDLEHEGLIGQGWDTKIITWSVLLEENKSNKTNLTKHIIS